MRSMAAKAMEDANGERGARCAPVSGLPKGRSSLRGRVGRAIALWMAGCLCGGGVALASENGLSADCQRVIADASFGGALYFESDGTTLNLKAQQDLLTLEARLQRFAPTETMVLFMGYQFAGEGEGTALYRAQVARRFLLSRGLEISVAGIQGLESVAAAKGFKAPLSGPRVEYEAKAWREFCTPPDWKSSKPQQDKP